jgi:hypothetical protein
MGYGMGCRELLGAVAHQHTRCPACPTFPAPPHTQRSLVGLGGAGPPAILRIVA